MNNRPPALPAELVQEFVSAAHTQYERVVELLAQQPALANAVWDWGGGDFESGLGAAAHMGRRDIALYLLAHGARFDLFAAAMLGQLELVRTVLAAQPELRHTAGAHGIPLLVHAQMGGPEAQAVVDWLQAETASA
jgi:hypothetical protein